jgi:hypothetical protein
MFPVVVFDIPRDADCGLFGYGLILMENISLTRVGKGLAYKFYKISHPLTMPPLP